MAHPDIRSRNYSIGRTRWNYEFFDHFVIRRFRKNIQRNNIQKSVLKISNHFCPPPLQKRPKYIHLVIAIVLEGV